MVFQLSDVLNELNGHDPQWEVEWIPFIQSSPNTPAHSNGTRLPDGRIPSKAQIAANASLLGVSLLGAAEDPAAASNAAQQFDTFLGFTPDEQRSIAKNVFAAHKAAVASGKFAFSEANYLRYVLDQNANITDYVAYSPNDEPEGILWTKLWKSTYFAATNWVTVDKGLSTLARAFTPLVQNRTTLNRKIEGLVWNETTQQIGVQWRASPLDQVPEVESYDYVVASVPFSKVRLWRTPGRLFRTMCFRLYDRRADETVFLFRIFVTFDTCDQRDELCAVVQGRLDV